MKNDDGLWRRRGAYTQLFFFLIISVNTGLSIRNYYATNEIPYTVLIFIGLFCVHLIVFPVLTKLSPWHMWRVWWGYDVECSYADSLSLEDFKLDEEAFEWAKKKSKGAVHRQYHGNYQFFRKSDAVMFKVAWG